LCTTSRQLEGLGDARNPHPASRAILEVQYEIERIPEGRTLALLHATNSAQLDT